MCYGIILKLEKSIFVTLGVNFTCFQSGDFSAPLIRPTNQTPMKDTVGNSEDIGFDIPAV
jgi:hypothetical protein